MPELVAIDLPGGPAFVAALRRAWDDGHAVLPVDQRLAPTPKIALLDALGAGRVVGPDAGAGSHRRAHGRSVEPGDALVMATSGTTGEPKGVVLTHDALAASARATSARLGVDPARHRWLACLPLNHVGGLSVVVRALLTGTPLTVLPGFDAAEVRAHSGAEVLVSLVATALGRVGAEHFHTVVLGGSAPPAGLASNVVTTYGLTETGSGVVYDGTSRSTASRSSIDAATDREIRLRGPMLARALTATAERLTDAEGWLPTGDAGSDGAGRAPASSEGRLSELIITGG